MKAQLEGNFVCECGFTMYHCNRYDDAGNRNAPSVQCSYSDCKHFGIRFFLPRIELEAVSKVTA